MIKASVDKVTQDSFNVDIKVINTPEGVNVKTFPKTAKVHYNVALSSYKNIAPKDFEVTLDYAQINTSSNYGSLKLSKQPKEVFNTSISPAHVEYLIRTTMKIIGITGGIGSG